MRRRAHLKNTLFGRQGRWLTVLGVGAIGIDIAEMVHAIPDPSSMSFEELGLRVLKIVIIAVGCGLARWPSRYAASFPQEERRGKE